LDVLDELLATDGVEEICELRSHVGLMAFHGGSLEAVTDVIAVDAAERAGASVYAIRQPWGFRWHIPSVAIDPAHSPALRAFLDHVDCAIAVHGWGTDGFGDGASMFRFGRDGRDRPLLVGGRNRALAARVAACLRSALPHYDVVDDIERIPRRVRGLDPRNVVNRVRNGGVQLELTPRVRGLPPFWEREQRGRNCPDTQALIAGLATSVA
jgi:phage replication-related protein YjqB (UPF0714/DUF867 family)